MIFILWNSTWLDIMGKNFQLLTTVYGKTIKSIKNAKKIVFPTKFIKYSHWKFSIPSAILSFKLLPFRNSLSLSNESLIIKLYYLSSLKIQLSYQLNWDLLALYSQSAFNPILHCWMHFSTNNKLNYWKRINCFCNMLWWAFHSIFTNPVMSNYASNNALGFLHDLIVPSKKWI